MLSYGEIRYEFKLFFAPIKWLICALFIVVIPFIFYAPSTLDVLNLWEIYAPLVGIVLFSDIMMVEKSNRTAEIVYLKIKRRTFSFVFRYSVTMILLIVFIACAIWIDGLFLGNLLTDEEFSFFFVLSIVGPGCLFFGTLALTSSNLFSSVPLGYLPPLVYWAYWMVGENMSRMNMLNPFKFANGYEYLSSKFMLLLLTFLFIVLNLFIIEQSPLKTLLRFNNQKR